MLATSPGHGLCPLTRFICTCPWATLEFLTQELPSSTCPVLRHSLAIHAPHPFPVPSPACQPSGLSSHHTPPHRSPLNLSTYFPNAYLAPLSPFSSSPLFSQHPQLPPLGSAPSLSTCSSSTAPHGGHAGHTSAQGLRYSCRQAQGDQVTCMGSSRGPFTSPRSKDTLTTTQV